MVYFNLSLDDIHPEIGCGLNKWKGPLKYCKYLIEEFPEIKITLFLTPNWIDLPNKHFFYEKLYKLIGKKYTNSWENEPFKITKFKKWCDWINSIPNFEIAIHGYNHHFHKNPHSAEFTDISYKESINKLKKSEELLKKCKIKYIKGFKPPGWGDSPAMYKSLIDLKYKYCASEKFGLKPYYLGKLLIIPQNWDIKKGTLKQAKELSKTKYIFAKGHIEEYYHNEKIMNGLTKKTYENIKNILNNLKKIKYIKMINLTKRVKK